MTLTESELQVILSRGHVKEHGKAAVSLLQTDAGIPISKKAKGPNKTENIRLILPFKLPTWNQLLAMDHWQRAKVRTWIKEQVLKCIQSGADWRTPTGSARKLLLTDLCLAEYSAMITPNSSKKLRSAKKLARLKKQ